MEGGQRQSLEMTTLDANIERGAMLTCSRRIWLDDFSLVR
jgi:hypothetical protein